MRQRVFGIALGYEDLNDHDALRHDLAVQTAVDRDTPLASAPTLCRFENAAGVSWAWAMHRVLMDVFIASHATPPEENVLDFDATDDAVHGHQQGRFFHGYYDHSCVNHATQWAGIEALNGPQITVDKMVAAFDERRKAIVEELNSLPGFRCVMPGGHSTPFPISPAPVSRRAKCRTDCWRSAG